MIDTNSNKSIRGKEEKFITLKVALRPARYYQLIRLNKSNLSDYNLLISRLSFVTKANSNCDFALFIKKDSIEYTITSEDQWLSFLSNASIKEWLQQLSTLKIEYEVLQTCQTKREQAQKREIESMKSDTFLSSIIDSLEQNPQLSKHLFNSLSQKSLKAPNDTSPSSNSNTHQHILIDKLTQVKAKIDTLHQIENSLLSTNFEEKDELTQSILLDPVDSKNLNKKEQNLPSFESYYNKESKDTFHVNLIRETLSSNCGI